MIRDGWWRRTPGMKAFLLCCVMLSSIAAFGTKPDDAKRAQARQRFEAGSKLYNVREFDKALEEFKAVYLLTGEPSLLFNIGQCERQLERYADARKSFLSFLREAQPSEEQREDVKRLIVSVDVAAKQSEQRKVIDSVPPPVVAQTAAPSIANAPAVAAAPRKRVRPWVWGVVTGSVVVGAAIAIGLGVGLTRGAGYPSPTQGSIDGN